MQHTASVIVTRPSSQAQEWLTALSEARFEVAALPLIQIALLDGLQLPEPLPLADYSAILFVSPNAVAGFLHNFALPADALLLAPGPGTARALLQAGAPATRIVQPDGSQQFDAAALWQTLQARCELDAQFKLLIITGEDDSASFNGGSAAWVAGQVAALGAYSAQLAVYRRSAPEFTVAQAELAQAAASNGSMWLFTSSQAIQNLQAALPDVDWRGAYSVATHPRIAQTARAAGFSVHECLPTLNDIVHTLHQLAPIASAAAD